MNIACIPAFNSEGTIGDIVKECQLHVDEVIVCDDGSTDDTAKIAKDNGATVLSHQKNYGYGAALITLFENAREINADCMVTLDADGQHIPEYIPRLLAPLSFPKNDVVIGSRFLDANSDVPAYRQKGIKLITAATMIDGGIKLTDAQSGFRAYSKDAIRAIHLTEYGMAASTEIIAKIINKGLKVVEVPIVIKYDDVTSKKKAIPHGISVLMSVLRYMSVKHPITCYGIPGIILVLAGTIFGFQFLDVYLNQDVVFIGTLMVSIILFVVGSIMVSTAILLYSMSILLKNESQ